MPVPLKIYCLNELGRRKNNEDSIWPPAGTALLGSRLFVVCDGVGGNSKGEVASELACRYFNDYFDHNLRSEDDLNVDFVNAAREWVIQQFKAYIEQNPGAEDMSTTLTLAYLKKNSVFTAWCGDSRIHLIRNGEVVYQSQDHSLVNELVRRGNITPEEALTHPHKNVITRSLQAKSPYSVIDTEELYDIQEHDYLLLCSDGLLENITPGAIKDLLSTPGSPYLIEQFQEYCLDRTRDNYSMYLVELINLNMPFVVPPAEKSVVSKKSKSSIKPIIITLVIIIILIAAIYGAYYMGYLKIK